MVLMTRLSPSLPLSPPDPRFLWLSSRCCVQQEGTLRLVILGGAPILRFEVGDQVQARLAAAMIAESGAAPVDAVLRAFAMDDVTLWRWRRRFREKGATALLRGKSGPKGPFKVRPGLVRRIVELDRKGLSAQSIGNRVGVSSTSVRRALQSHGGSSQRVAEVVALPLEKISEKHQAKPGTQTLVKILPSEKAEISASSMVAVVAPVEVVETLSSTVVRAPSPEMAAVYAMLGLTPDGEAEVVFESRTELPFAGALLAIPALNATGLLEAARSVYGGLRKGVYGLRATVLVLFLMALLRRPRPEALKGADPQALGDVLGLLRAPEVKTVRRKLREIAALGKAHKLMRALGSRWLQEREDELGILYVDGHVRVYNGKNKLPKAFVTQRNLCSPGTTDFWVNDVDGDPIFVVTGEANPALTQVLPNLLSELEEMAAGRKGMVVFDRGGWSPKLFRKLIDADWDILTYRKGKRLKHPRAQFVERTEVIDGRRVTYTLSERVVHLGKKRKLQLREVAELHDDGGQTIFVTNDFEHSAVLLAYRMFGRWRQENYFRYMLENFALDALVDYDSEPDDPNREVLNPARKVADRKLAQARAELADLERAYGAAAADNVETERHTMRGFKIANGQIGKTLRAAREKVAQLEGQRSRLPKRVAVRILAPEDRVVRLSPERKLFTDAIKAATYRAETVLLNLLRPHFKRAEDEGRAFLRNVVTQRGEVVVHGDEVLVRLEPLSAPRFTAALSALCDDLNASAPTFPESGYRFRYEVAEPREAA